MNIIYPAEILDIYEVVNTSSTFLKLVVEISKLSGTHGGIIPVSHLINFESKKKHPFVHSLATLGSRCCGTDLINEYNKIIQSVVAKFKKKS